MAGVCTGPGPCVTTPTGTGNNWVTRSGGLPDYVRALVNAFKRKGVPESIAVQRAIGVLQNWASGRGNVTAATRARAIKAITEWEALKAKAKADLAAAPTTTVDLAADPVLATTDGPNLTVPAAHRYHHGWVRIDASTPTAVERASRAVATDGHTLLHGPGMVAAAQRVAERVRAMGHGTRVRRIHLAGKTHLHVARTTR